ncbi:MAG: pyridoxal phosphate-dependent aminotransferase [Halococcoides sp.]
MTIEPSERVARVGPSGIRRFFELAEEVDDLISLGVGEPDFSAPWTARQAAIDSLERGKTSYTANRGKRELREAIADDIARYDLTYDPDDEIIVTTGVSEALDLAHRAIVDPGDTVAVVDPSYVSYVANATFVGADVVRVPTREDAFVLTRSALESVGAADADVLLMGYPNNPTGATMTREQLEPVAAFARDHDLTVISDEIYAELTYGRDHVSIAALPGMRERTIVLNGFSKAFAMTGLRLGYACGPPEAIDAMNRIHQYTMLSAPTTAQYAAIEALDSSADAVEEMREQYNRRRRVVLTRFEEMGLTCFRSSGAFYAFPESPWADGEAFAEALIEAEQVAVVPGTAFGPGGRDNLRVSYATGMRSLREALNRVERFVEAYPTESAFEADR